MQFFIFCEKSFCIFNAFTENYFNLIIVYIFQFTRKRHGYKVGEKIFLRIGTDSGYLKDFLVKNQNTITDKINVENLEIISGELTEEKGKIYGQLNICPNRDCSAALKDKTISRLEKKTELDCPHCNSKINKNSLKTIKFNFKRK